MAEKGSTVFVSTHYMEEAEYCQRLALMHAGKVIALGTPRELKDAAGEGTKMEDVFIQCIEREEAQEEGKAST